MTAGATRGAIGGQTLLLQATLKDDQQPST
jgi:hypothetical protein